MEPRSIRQAVRLTVFGAILGALPQDRWAVLPDAHQRESRRSGPMHRMSCPLRFCPPGLPRRNQDG